MPHYTITPANSIYLPGTALTLGLGDDLTILTGGYLAGDGIGLSLAGGNLARIWGSVTGGETAISTTGAASLRLGAGSMVSGQTALWTVGESLDLIADGAMFGNIGVRVSESFDIAVHGDLTGNMDLRAVPVGKDPRFEPGNRLELGGHLSGDLVVDASDLTLALAGAEVGNLWAKGFSLLLTGQDFMAEGVSLRTPTAGIGHAFPRILVMDVQGADFGKTLEVSGYAMDLHLDGATVGILRLKGIGAYVTLEGAEVDFIRCNTVNGYVDARGAVELRQIQFMRGDDHFWGGDTGTVVDDFGGADQILLGAGDDWVTVARKDHGANDVFAGGAGWDVLNYFSLEFKGLGLHIDLAGGLVTTLSPRARGAVGEDRISGFERIIGSNGDDLIEGADAAEHLWGHRGRDTIRGGAGDDTLVASGERDLLFGGAGADVFRFQTEFYEKSRLHRVADFEAGLDRIDLSPLEYARDGGPDEFVHFTQGTGAGTFQLTEQGRWTRVHVELLSGMALDFLVSAPLTEGDFIL